MRAIAALFRRTAPRQRVRLAIVSTPRSGNTWLRAMLSSIYQTSTHVAVHRPSDVPWSHLPDRYLLQIHWPCDRGFLDRLNRHDFRVVSLARHPFDVLISILKFCGTEPETVNWLDGAGGDEIAIRGTTPISPEFLAYAAGPRAAALLAVSHHWWLHDGAVRLRYEDLVRDPVDALSRLVKAIGYPVPPEALPMAIITGAFNKLQATSTNRHFWQGRPGLWRSLLPADASRRIEAAHAAVFRDLGYDCQPDPDLDAAQALATWQALQ